MLDCRFMLLARRLNVLRRDKEGLPFFQTGLGVVQRKTSEMVDNSGGREIYDNILSTEPHVRSQNYRPLPISRCDCKSVATILAARLLSCELASHEATASKVDLESRW
jgi:hypothetical protein